LAAIEILIPNLLYPRYYFGLSKILLKIIFSSSLLTTKLYSSKSVPYLLFKFSVTGAKRSKGLMSVTTSSVALTFPKIIFFYV
jgi:hypothetical protein